MLNPHKIKEDFPILKTLANGKPLVYLDNAATSQKPQSVIDTICRYYLESNANIHRGVYSLSEKATKLYENARANIAKFIGARYPEEIIFTKNATESMNLLATSFCRSFMSPGAKILITQGEHHSNVIPWQLNLPQVDGRLEQIDLDGDGRINLADLKKKLTPKVKLISIAHASNSSGVIHNIKLIIEWAHARGILVAIDACQSVPHLGINVQKMDADFLAFSGHKMLGPTGIGILYGKKELLEKK